MKIVSKETLLQKNLNIVSIETETNLAKISIQPGGPFRGLECLVAEYSVLEGTAAGVCTSFHQLWRWRNMVRHFDPDTRPIPSEADRFRQQSARKLRKPQVPWLEKKPRFRAPGVGRIMAAGQGLGGGQGEPQLGTGREEDREWREFHRASEELAADLPAWGSEELSQLGGDPPGELEGREGGAGFRRREMEECRKGQEGSAEHRGGLRGESAEFRGDPRVLE